MSEEKDSRPWLIRQFGPTALHDGDVTGLQLLLLFMALVWVGGVIYLLFDLALLFAPNIERDITEARTLILILAAWGGAPFLVWRSIIADQQRKIAHRQTEIAQQTHYTDLFTKAVEQLGATRELSKDGSTQTEPNIEVRLGGIYALQRIAEESERDYLPIMNTLCAYIRKNLQGVQKPPNNLPADPNWPEISSSETELERQERIKQYRNRATELQKWRNHLLSQGSDIINISSTRPDIVAALDALGDRPEKWMHLEKKIGIPVPRLDLSDPIDGESAEARNQRFFANDGRISSFMKDFEKWSDRKWRPNLSDCSFQGLFHPNINLQCSDLRMLHAEGAYLPDARLEGAWTRVSKMAAINLSRAKLSWVDFSHAEMEAANLENADMRGAEFFQTRLICADLSGAYLDGALVVESRLEAAILKNSKFRGADLSGSVLCGSTLAGADLSHSLLTSVDLRDTDISWEQLDSAFGDRSTWSTVPERFVDFDPPDHWSAQDLRDDFEEANRQWKAWLASRSAT